MPELRVSVLGLGYLGATHAVCMASLGFDVVGVDVEPERVASLTAGVLPFVEPGLGELLVETLATGRLRFSTDYADAADADVHFVCVGTPQRADSGAADLSQVHSCIDALGPQLRRRCLVVGKSTVPVGTAEHLTERLAALAPASGEVELAWSPEFLREGFAVKDTLHPDRLVFGVASEWAEATLRDVFAPVIAEGMPVVVTDLATSQLVKVAANAFLATKISFINAMAEVCEVTGADVTLLSEALKHDTRIGGRFLHAGLGFGGGCLPKDIRAFMARADELGVEAALGFLTEVDAINQRRRARMVDLAHELLGDALSGSRIAVLGASFKPDSDDVRDSPALDVAHRLHDAGATVVVTDPAAIETARKRFPQLTYAAAATDALRDADLVLHLTEWRDYRALDPAATADMVAHPRIIDGRNALDPVAWRRAGWTYRALGRP